MTKLPYNKPYKSLHEQLQLLKDRGMTVTDEERALQYLERIGYYRLSGYWYPFRKSVTILDANGKLSVKVLDPFHEGTEFRHAVDLYVFDKRLRLLFLDAIERIEVAVRVDIALLLGKRDRWAHRNPEQLHGKFTRKFNGHEKWLESLKRNEERAKEDFVKHFHDTYIEPLPIWVAIELWDFGMLSTFLDGMKFEDKRIIAKKYGINRPELLTSWMRAINHIRNISAHHNRLWNCSPVDQPKLPKKGEIDILEHLVGDKFGSTKLYAIAAIIQFLLQTINKTTTWPERLKQHFRSFPVDAPCIKIEQAGFPSNWESLPLWKSNSNTKNH